jgi:hypothetical protein
VTRPIGIGLSGCLSTLPHPCTHPPSLAVSCVGPSTHVCTDMVVLRGIHSGCCPHHPFILDVGTFGMHEVHSVRHSGGEPLGAGDTTFRACISPPSQTECSHSHSHPCAGVHGWRVANTVPVSVRRASCAVRGTVVPLLVKLRRLIVPGMRTRCGVYRSFRISKIN